MRTTRAALRASVAASAWLLLAACGGGGPEPIDYGRDGCDYCRMVISDPRYGAELVTTKGKVHRFDSIECLAAYYLQERDARGGGTVRSLWVSNFAAPGTFIAAADAKYVRAQGPSSPMGKGLTAFAANADPAALGRVSGGTPVLGWAEVLALVEREGMPQGLAPDRSTAAPGGAPRETAGAGDSGAH